MVPKGLLVVGILLQLRVSGFHLSDNGLGALQTFFLCRQFAGVGNHLLNLTAVFRHDELLALCVVI